MKEQVLIRECLQGKAHAQKALFDTYAGKVMGICIRYMKDRDEANDLLQESFIRIFNGLKNFRKDAPLDAWIRRITINTCLEHLRKSNELNKVSDKDPAEEEQASFENPDQALQAEDLIKIIQNLPTGYRTIFNLYAIEGYTHKEIAEQLGISEGTSKSQYSRARQELQKIISFEHINT